MVELLLNRSVLVGHNLPDGEDRYCIDLVCVAGQDWRSKNGTAPTLVVADSSSFGGNVALVCFLASLLCCALAAGAHEKLGRMIQGLGVSRQRVGVTGRNISVLGEGWAVAQQDGQVSEAASKEQNVHQESPLAVESVVM